MDLLSLFGLICLWITTVNNHPIPNKKITSLHDDDSFAISEGNFEEIKDDHDLFEFDMKFSKKQRDKRAVTQVVKWKWPDGVVPYVFDTILPISEAKKTIVLKAFKHIEEFTCTRFIPRTNHADFVNITTLQGCWSYVGRTGGMQEYSLGNNCEYFGVIVHETLHALGFYHEHNRPDRDDYITVNFTNIKTGAENAFNKFTLDNSKTGHISLQEISYDISSIMHYERYTFTKHVDEDGYLIPGQPSMTLYAKGNPDQALGNTGLSYKDKLRVNKYYGCSNTTAATTTSSTKGALTGSSSDTTGALTGSASDTTTKITTTTNGSLWGKPDHAAHHQSSFWIIMLISFVTLFFINIS